MRHVCNVLMYSSYWFTRKVRTKKAGCVGGWSASPGGGFFSRVPSCSKISTPCSKSSSTHTSGRTHELSITHTVQNVNTHTREQAARQQPRRDERRGWPGRGTFHTSVHIHLHSVDEFRSLCSRSPLPCCFFVGVLQAAVLVERARARSACKSAACGQIQRAVAQVQCRSRYLPLQLRRVTRTQIQRTA